MTNEYERGPVDQVEIVFGDLHLRCDIVDERVARQAKLFAEGFGVDIWDLREGKMNKYMREIRSGVWVDVYDVLSAFEVTDPAVQHAVKKLLAAGQRGIKSALDDYCEAMQSISRAIEIEERKSS